MKIIMMGPQGSGKGTQAKLLGKRLGIPHISTGDLLRAELAEQTDIGKAVAAILEAGRLVPDDIILDMLGRRLSRDECAGGFIADGFPRNLGQLLNLRHVWQVDHAIQLWIDTQTSIDRLASRVNCPECKETYGPKKPPAREGICDNCGTALKKRADDSDVKPVIQRLELYWTEMQPVLEYFRSGGVLTTLDGNQSIEAIERMIAETVGT